MIGVVNEFFHWWGQGLAYFVPKRLIASRKQLPAYVLVTPNENGFDIEHIGGDTSKRAGPRRLEIAGESENQSIRVWLGEILAPNTPVILRLPVNTVLIKRMSAPAVALDKVRSMLEFEIDRQTPFSKDQVYFDFRLLEGDRDSKKLQLDLGVAPRAVVDGFIERLARWDIVPGIIDTDEIHFEECGFNLKEPDLDDEHRTGKRSPALYVGLACALTGALCLVPYYQTETRINELESVERGVRAQAAEVAVLRKRRDEIEDQRRFIAELESEGTAPLQILNELTRLLPDDSWIIRLEIKQGNVTIQGESSSASSLIEVLQDSPLVDNPHFVSPITLNTASGKERFRISMSVTNGGRA